MNYTPFNIELLNNCNIGLEREALRINSNGQISDSFHPKSLGDKLFAKHITTDFCESQTEMITPPLKSIYKVAKFCENAYDLVCANLDSEMLWNYSMPCIIDKPIKVADYGPSVKDTNYRKMLLKKYGGKKQLISGIHYNFSFGEKFIEESFKRQNEYLDIKDFKSSIYLKLARNFIRYHFLLIYLTGCSPYCLDSFTKECVEFINNNESQHIVSLRNSKFGYRNHEQLLPSYNSLAEHIADLNSYVEKGLLIEHKEFYSPIRLKSKSGKFEDLNENGIEYIEIRCIDINPFEKIGVSIKDLQFIKLFLIYLLFKEETPFPNYQAQGYKNSDTIALFGLSKDITINGKPSNAKEHSLTILDEIKKMCENLNIDAQENIDYQRSKITDSKNCYSQKLTKEKLLETILQESRQNQIVAVENYKNFNQDTIDLILANKN